MDHPFVMRSEALVKVGVLMVILWLVGAFLLSAQQPAVQVQDLFTKIGQLQVDLDSKVKYIGQLEARIKTLEAELAKRPAAKDAPKVEK